VDVLQSAGTVAGIVLTVVTVASLGYGIYGQRAARAETRKRIEAEDKLRRFQTDPVIVILSGGGSSAQGSDHPSQMSVVVEVQNQGQVGAVALNVRAGIAKGALEVPSATHVPAIGASEVRSFQLDVPVDITKQLSMENPHGQVDLWVTY
jgi:hypothetical protein